MADVDVTELSAETLIASAYSLKDEFFELHDSDDYSDETLDRMAEIVDELETLQAEADRRVTLAVKREELVSRVNVNFQRGNPEALISYWRDGEGAERIAWGTEGDFTRCMQLVGKYLPEDAGGFCQNRHIEIYGEANATRDARAKAE